MAFVSDVCLQAKFEVITANNEPRTKLFFVDIGILTTADYCNVCRVFNVSRKRLLSTSQI